MNVAIRTLRSIGLPVFVLLASGAAIAQVAGTLKWAFQAGDLIESSPAVSPDGTVLIKSRDGFLYAINGRSGALKWKFFVGVVPTTRFSSSPAIESNGTIYIGGAEHLFSLNPDGSLRWASLGGYSLLAGGPITTRHPDTFNSPSLGLDGRIHVSSRAGRLYTFDRDGNLLSNLASSNSSPRNPVVDSQGTVWICNSSVPEGNGATSLSRIRPDGSGATSLISLSSSRGDPCAGKGQSVGLDGTIYTLGSGLLAVTPDGTIKWRFPPSSDVGTFIGQIPAVAADGTLYALSGIFSYSTTAAQLTALSPSGTLLWSFPLGNMDWAGSYTPAVDSNGVIYAGSGSTLFAVARSGTLKWSFRTNSPVTTSPTIDGAGTVYLGTFDGKVFAVHGDSTGLAASSWPMEGSDARHSSQAKRVLPLVFANPADCLFTWAEFHYSTLFAPSPSESFALNPPYYYRYYRGTNAYLGTSTDGHVYYLGPLSNGTILDVGPLRNWLTTAGCVG